MIRQAVDRYKDKALTVYEALTDIGSIKSFDYEAFFSYIQWCTFLFTVRFGSAYHGSSVNGLNFTSHFLSRSSAFIWLYSILPFAASFTANYKLETASLLERRIIISAIFVVMGNIAGFYYPRKYRVGSNDLFLPFLANCLFYFLAPALKEHRLSLIGLCVAFPASISIYGAYIYHYFSWIFVISLIQNCLFTSACLQLAIRAYREVGLKSERDIFKMVVRLAVTTEFLGIFSMVA